jgi:hypothetical protein
MSPVGPIPEYSTECWDPCRGQINTLYGVQTKAAPFTNHTHFSDLETVAQRKSLHAYAHFIKRILGNGLGKLHATGCDGITI